MTTQLLFGKIAHWLDFPLLSKDTTSSKKRKRSQTAADFGMASAQSDGMSLCGFIFLPHEVQKQYFLSVPKELLRRAYDAAISQRDVCLSKFRQVSYNKEVSWSKMSMLEVHRGGLEILQQNHQNGVVIEYNTYVKPLVKENLWTLTQWWRKEMVDSAMIARKSRDKVNIVATVDAISPIITLDPNNPFALVEVYDKDNTDVTSVVVMNGKAALVAHSAIFPLETLIFQNLVYKAWSIPAMIQKEAPHLVGRVPSHVFVAMESDCISWDHPVLSQSNACGSSTILPAITPVNLLTRIHGTIKHVQTTSVSSGRKSYTSILYIDITVMFPTDRNQPSGRRTQCYSRLYLAHFPMSTSLQMSLRKGATIEVNNVHQLSNLPCTHLQSLPVEGEILPIFVYAACLRSSLIVLIYANDNAVASSQSHNAVTSLPLIRFPWQDYPLRKFKETYRQMMFRDLVKDWAQQNFRSTANTLPMSWILETLMNGSQRNDEAILEIPDSRKSSQRDPYAEFFDHPTFLSSFGSDSMRRSCGCNVSDEDSSTLQSNAVHLIGLDTIRRKSQDYLIKKIKMRLQEANFNPISTGWSGSVIVRPEDLFMETSGIHGLHMQKEMKGTCNYYIGGNVSELGSFSKCGNVVGIIDDVCRLPVNTLNKRGEAPKINDFVLGQVATISISCLCLGASTRNMESHEKGQMSQTVSSIASSVSLPALSDDKKLLGGCSLVTVHDLLFVASLHVHCLEIAASSKSIAERDNIDPFISIEECIRTATRNELLPQTGTVQGTVIRRFFGHKMQRNGSQRGCEIVVASVPRTKRVERTLDSSCLQRMDISVCFRQNTSMMLRLVERLNHVWQNGPLSDAQRSIVASFWALGDSGNTSALLLGGTEDLASGSSSNTLYVQVYFPLSSVERTKLGFVFASCKHSQIGAYMMTSSQVSAEDQVLESFTRAVFDFEAKSKLEKGLLCTSLHRRQMVKSNNSLEREVGETIARCSDAIPRVSLSQIFDRMCQFLQNGDTANLHPSLVQCIPNACLLGISFCKVQAYCTHCFSVLSDVRQRGRAGMPLFDDTDEPSFWHLPDPREPQGAKSQPESDTGETHLKYPHKENIQRSSLQCPNQCGLHFYRVKWECSGILDDNTGQATVYADGNAALALLGMTEETIRKIEQGVWHVRDGGLTFKKSIPPSTRLRTAIRNILIRKVATAEQTRLLSLPLRAEYLLQMHCRSSTQPRRPLDFYVRCKPLQDKARHLHHTTLDSFVVDEMVSNAPVFHTEVSSYALPSLKLQLVDCAALEVS